MFPLNRIQMVMPFEQTLTWENIDPHINVLIGLNGSGKTVLLHRICADLNGKQHDPLFKHKLFKPKQKSNLKADTVPCLLLDGAFMAMAEQLNEKGKEPSQKDKNSLMDKLLSDNLDQLSHYPLETRDPFLNTIDRFFKLIHKSVLFGGKAINNDIGKAVGFKHFSSGEKKILYIFSSLYLMHLHNPQFVLLADCIEYSLSCDWQRILISQISQLCPNAQIIITTHSPFIMDKYPDKTHDIEDLIV